MVRRKTYLYLRKQIFILTAVYFQTALTNHQTGESIMTNTDNSLELSSDEVNNRLDELYAELKTLKPYLPFQQIKRVLAELKWIISMRENSSV